MRYIVYDRVSTEMQDVITQQTMILKYIESQPKGEILMFSDPDVSSRLKMTKREGLMEMLGSLKKDDLVIVYKLDRLSRDIVEMVNIYRLIKAKKCFIHSLNDSNADDEFMIGLMGVLAQKERSDISKRTKDCLSCKKSNHERVSRFPPYGFKLTADKKSVEPEHNEQVILAYITEMFHKGYSYREIQMMTISKGYMNRKGKPFQHMSIFKMLQRKGMSRDLDQSQMLLELNLSDQS